MLFKLDGCVVVAREQETCSVALWASASRYDWIACFANDGNRRAVM